MSWLSVEQMCRIVFALPVSIVVARYLGPEQLGVLNYANALVGLFAPLAALGLSGIVVRDLVQNKSDANETLGSAFFIQVIGSLLATVLSVGVVLYLRTGQLVVQVVVAIATLRTVFSALKVIDFWFQSKVASEHVVKARLLATSFVLIIKLALVLCKASLITFAVATTIESFLVGAFLSYAYWLNKQSVFQWKPSFRRSTELLFESWPLTISGFAIIVQAYIDQVMLGEMLNDAVVGQYSVAIRLIAFVAFLPAIVQKSWAPSVAAAKSEGKEAYHRRLSRLYQMMFAIFLTQGIPIFLFAEPLTVLLYGVEFTEAGALLALLAIRLLFTNFGLARSVYITNESLFRHSMITAIAGCTVNIATNYILIPHYGARGAIVATIVSFFVTIFLLDAISGRTRENFFLMLMSPLAASRTTVRVLRARVG